MARRVIVVDDDADARILARRALEADGIEVEEAASVQEFLAMLEAGSNPAAVVLDLTMPGASGWDALNTLRGDPMHKNLPVVIVTARDDDQFRLGAKRSGVKHYITKPYKPWDLVDAVKSSTRPTRRDPWADAR